MKALTLILISALTLVAANSNLQAVETPENDQALGERIVRQVWADAKAPNIKAVEQWLARGFQAVQRDGVRNRQQQIELIKKLNLGKYELSKFKVTRSGPVLVVTYIATAPQTIKGKRISGVPARRLSVFLKTKDGWRWIAHANLMPMK
jgi:ketosteroid isomerase-like protein